MLLLSLFSKWTEVIIVLMGAALFLIIALAAGIYGFFGIASAAVGIAKILFFVFLILFVVSFIMSRRRNL